MFRGLGLGFFGLGYGRESNGFWVYKDVRGEAAGPAVMVVQGVVSEAVEVSPSRLQGTSG